MRGNDRAEAAQGSPQSSRFSFFKSFSGKRATLACVTVATALLLPAAASADPPAHGRLAALDVTGLNHACGAATDSKGDLYASSAEDNEIKVFDAEHNELTSIEDTEEPCALAVQTDGTLYVSERGTGEVVRYEPNLYPLEASPTYGAREVIDASGKAAGIAVDPVDNRLYVAEGDRISIYKADGTPYTIDERQTVQVSEATGGSFRLEFEGQKTAPIPYNASAEELKAALEALATIGAGNVEVKKPAAPYEATFTGALGGKDLEALVADPTGLEGGGGQSVSIAEAAKGFDGQALQGELTEATGVAPYTSTEASLLYLAVADASGDVLKLFSGPTAASAMKSRGTISGVDADGDPETPDQEFEFGSAGAYVSADPGNESAAHKCTQVEVKGQKQACTAGHLFLYDAAHEAVDEFDSTGHFVDRLSAPGLADGQPTQVAVQRTGTEGDGTIYVSSGASTAAKLFAFGPLPLPGRELDEARSHVLAKAKAVAVDAYGYVYVAAQKFVYVFDPEGTEVVKFETPTPANDLAIDSQCDVYAVEGPSAPAATYYEPSQCPPTPSTTFTRHEPALLSSLTTPTAAGTASVAVDPADDHVYVVGNFNFTPGIFELKAASEGSGVIGECAGVGLSPYTSRVDIDVNAATGEVYFTANSRHLSAVTCEEPELLREIKGGGCPAGQFAPNPTIAIDQSNGHLAEFDSSQASAREYEAGGACVAEFGSFIETSGDYRVALDNSCAIHDPPLHGEACETFDPAYGTAYVAFDSTNPGQKKERQRVQTSELPAAGPRRRSPGRRHRRSRRIRPPHDNPARHHRPARQPGRIMRLPVPDRGRIRTQRRRKRTALRRGGEQSMRREPRRNRLRSRLRSRRPRPRLPHRPGAGDPLPLPPDRRQRQRIRHRRRRSEVLPPQPAPSPSPERPADRL